mgnify:CR=1 FL=1
MPIPRKIALLCLLLASATGAQASQALSLPQALAAAFAMPGLAAAEPLSLLPTEVEAAPPPSRLAPLAAGLLKALP